MIWDLVLQIEKPAHPKVLFGFKEDSSDVNVKYYFLTLANWFSRKKLVKERLLFARPLHRLSYLRFPLYACIQQVIASRKRLNGE